MVNEQYFEQNLNDFLELFSKKVQTSYSGQGFDFRPEFLRKHQKCSVKSREVRKWIEGKSSLKELMGNSFDLPGDPMSSHNYLL